MMRNRAILAFGLFCVLGGMDDVAEAVEPDKPSSASSDLVSSQTNEWYERANALYLDEKYVLACAFYKAAWDQRRHYKIAANLGSCEYALGKYRDAAEHLAFFLRAVPRDVPVEERAYFVERQANAAKHVATLIVHISDAGAADVFVDDTAVGKAPLNGPIYVNPGPHTVHARNKVASGHQQVDLRRGETRTISLAVLPPPGPPPPPVEPSSVPVAILGAGGGFSLSLLFVGATFSSVEQLNPGFFSPAPSAKSANFALTWGSMVAAAIGGVVTATAVFTTSRWTSQPIRVAPRVGMTANTWQLGIDATF